MLDCSGLAIDADGRVAGAILIAELADAGRRSAARG